MRSNPTSEVTRGRFEAGRKNRQNLPNDSILSPQKTRLGSRLSSMYLDIDARVLDRKKKEQYRNELEQQISARSPDKYRKGKRNNLHKNDSIGDDFTMRLRPQHTEQNSKANLQLRYKQELDKQLALKESERKRTNENVIVNKHLHFFHPGLVYKPELCISCSQAHYLPLRHAWACNICPYMVVWVIVYGHI